MCLPLFDFKSGKQPIQFTIPDYNCILRILCRPFEGSLFKSAEIQPESIMIPIQDFNHCPAPVAEYKQVCRERIEVKALLDYCSKPVN